MSAKRITSLITFRVREGQGEAFIAAFGACGMLSRPRAVAGFAGAELLRQCGDGRNFAVIARWDSAQAYADWRRVARSGAPPEALRALAACIESSTEGLAWAAVAPDDGQPG